MGIRDHVVLAHSQTRYVCTVLILDVKEPLNLKHPGSDHTQGENRQVGLAIAGNKNWEEGKGDKKGRRRETLVYADTVKQ